MRKQPNPNTGYRFTEYRIVHSKEEWPLIEWGHIYHKTDLSDLEEPYLSVVKEALAKEKADG